MRRILAIAAIGAASVAYGVGLGSSTAFTTAQGAEVDADVVRIADRGDSGYCPFDHRSPTEESSA